MNDFVQFVRRVEGATGKKRGRRPVFNANGFYPHAVERSLAVRTKAELEAFIGRCAEAALFGTGFEDDAGELSEVPESVSPELAAAVGAASEAIRRKASLDFAEWSEMIVGKPYYPPEAEAGIFTAWEANFKTLCKSAEADAKKDISRLLVQSKNEGWNKSRLEREIKARLPSKYKARAENIARTETGKLNSAAKLSQFREVGFKYYKWLTTIDGRERDSHRAMNGLICSVSDPGVYFTENPDDPMHPASHPRTAAMFRGNPGEDFQCRCSMVAWDPEIDGKYEVKETPEAETPEDPPESAENGDLRTELEKTKAEAAEREKGLQAALKKAERKAEILRAANERHAARAPESEAATVAAWNARRIRRTAEARHAARTAEREKAIRTELQRRLGFREDARKILAESEGIDGIGREGLEAAAKGGNAKSYKAMEREAAAIGKRLDELKAMQHVGDPMAAAKKYGYPDTVAAEKAVESTLNDCGFASLSNPDKKTALENEIAFVKKRKGNAARLELMAYDRLLAGVETEIKWEGLKTGFDAIKAAVKAHPKSAKLAAAYGKLETAFNARNEADFNAALAEAKKAVPKPKKAERKAEILRAANERHAARTVDSREKILSRHDRTKIYKDFIERAKAEKIAYLKVSKHDRPLNEKEIIERLCGGDLTKGSCSSLALAYAANKAGYDVLDFRNGKSRKFFADGDNVHDLVAGAGGVVAKDKNGFTAAKIALRDAKVGKEYYFAAGSHAAIIRKKLSGGFEYLELQSSKLNGFKPLSDIVLADRFKVKRSRTYLGIRLDLDVEMIDVELLADSPKFKKLMGFINTEEGKQFKGKTGGIK